MAVSHSHSFFIQWHLTERCNLRCKHCYQEGRASEEMGLSELRLVMEEAAEMISSWREAFGIDFSPSVSLTGGEPLLREDVFHIIGDLGERGFDVFLLSNGTLIDRSAAGRLAALGVKGVQVSIEGPGRVHEKLRGEGSFASSVRGVSHLLDAGLTVTLNVTLSSINAGRFMELVEIAVALGVQRLGFSRLVPSGRGRGLMKETLGKKQLRKLYGEILSTRVSGLEVVTGDPVAAQMGATGEEDCGGTPVGGCAAGISGLTLLPDGTVLPCRRLPVPLGNVRRDSLREIWASSEVLSALRDRSRYQGRCASCRRWAVCRGCRAIAYAQEGSYLAEDPGCFIK